MIKAFLTPRESQWVPPYGSTTPAWYWKPENDLQLATLMLLVVECLTPSRKPITTDMVREILHNMGQIGMRVRTEVRLSVRELQQFAEEVQYWSTR